MYQCIIKRGFTTNFDDQSFLFEVNIVFRSLVKVWSVLDWCGQMKKGCKPVSLQPCDSLCGAYRNRTDDLLTARKNKDISTQLHYTIIHYITKTM